MKKFRRSIMGSSGKSQQDSQPEVVSVHLQSTSTVLDDLRGQATWEEDWMDANPGMVTATNHERKVHLLSDLLGNADGVLAFREVLASTPALRALMSETGPGTAAASEKIMVLSEAKYHVVGEKLAGGQNTLDRSSRGKTSTKEFYHNRDRLRSLLDREDNSSCADCTAKLPTWASVNTGVFLCTQCAGCHRSLGVHISKVLSVQLDDWTREQVEFMAGMGNGMANSFLEYHVPNTWLKPSHLEPRDYREAYVKAKYQERLFEFRAQKKPVIKPPPEVSEFSSSAMSSSNAGGGEAGSGGGALERRVSASQQGMTEYIGFVNIVLVRGENLVSPGFGQLHYMAVLRIGGQEVRSRPARADGSPSWSEKLMLCWDGGMPLVIEMYGGKEHIGQAEVSLRKLLLDEGGDGDGDDANPDDISFEGDEDVRDLSPRSRLLRSRPEDQQRRGQAESSPGKAASVLSSSGFSDAPPTLSSLSSPAAASVLTPRSSTELTTAAKVEGAPELPSAAANGSIGGLDGVEGFGASTANFADDGMDDDLLAFAGNSYKAGTGSESAGGGGGGGGAGAGASRNSSSNKRVFVQPLPLAARRGSLESTSSPIETLPGGELYITLQDKKDCSTPADRLTGLSPMAAPGSVGSSRAPSPRRTPRNNGSRAGSPRPALSNRPGIGGNASGSMGSKSFNSRILKLGKSGSSSGGGGGALGQPPSRPAQGGVVIKMDFVRIEH